MVNKRGGNPASVNPEGSGDRVGAIERILARQLQEAERDMHHVISEGYICEVIGNMYVCMYACMYVCMHACNPRNKLTYLLLKICVCMFWEFLGRKLTKGVS